MSATYAQARKNRKDLLKHPQRMYISSFNLTNDTFLTLIFNFYLDLELQFTKINHWC